jgi:hypothetical protein
VEVDLFQGRRFLFPLSRGDAGAPYPKSLFTVGWILSSKPDTDKKSQLLRWLLGLYRTLPDAIFD